jgi:hypothetical protein
VRSIRSTGKKDDSQKGILVLCRYITALFMRTGVSAGEQKEAVMNRPVPVRKQLRLILGYTPRPYTPRKPIRKNVMKIVSGSIRLT